MEDETKNETPAYKDYTGKRVEFNDDVRGTIIGSGVDHVRVMLDGDDCRAVWIKISELEKPEEGTENNYESNNSREDGNK